ncbi:MAG: TIGR00289 family protein, partial [Euryarchaeota archaeon]|nr:TIGR00289 family protein [Euryarchaeota archaeon]
LVSGGKDSVFALYRAVKAGHKVVYILNMLPEREDSWMFHHPNAALVELQARALGIPLVRGTTAGEKEAELEDLRRLLANVAGEVEGVVTGALASNYQRERIERLCSELGLEVLSPLWGIEPEKYWEELLASGFEVMITAVAAEGLGEEWLGVVVTREKLAELKRLAEQYRFHLGFEGGEAETLVLDMPLFRQRLVVKKARKLWRGNSGVYIIEEAELVPKHVA